MDIGVGGTPFADADVHWQAGDPLLIANRGSLADMSEPSRDELLAALRREFKWVSDRGQDASYADLTGWWRDPVILRGVGEALAGLVRPDAATVVVGPESRGVLLGALTAAALEVGFVEVRKDHGPSAHSDALAAAYISAGLQTTATPCLAFPADYSGPAIES